MKTLFYDVVRALFKELKREPTLQSGETVAQVHIEGYTFQIGLLEQSRAIVMQGVVGLLPLEREKACLYLLNMNNLFSETRGDTLGLDDDAITLQRWVNMEGLDEAAFVESAFAFMDNLLLMLNKFSQFYLLLDAAELSEQTDSTQEPGLTMIRI